MAVVDWFIDGTAVRRSTVRLVTSRAGWHNVNPFVGQNIAVPSRHGEIWVPKKVGAGAFSLDIWLYGNTDQKINDEWDRLLSLVMKPHRLLTVEKRLPNQEVRYCEAELTGSIQPTMVGRHGMRATLQFRIPSGTWRSQKTWIYESTPGSSLSELLLMPGIADSTAPINDALVIVRGPITDFTVRSRVDDQDHEMTYGDTVPAGASVIINTGTWSMRGANTSSNPAALSTNGDHLLTINPSSSPNVRLYGTGGGSQTNIRVEVKSAYIA